MLGVTPALAATDFVDLGLCHGQSLRNLGLGDLISSRISCKISPGCTAIVCRGWYIMFTSLQMMIIWVTRFSDNL